MDEADPALGLARVLTDACDIDPACDPGLSEHARLRMFRELLRVRRLDERLVGLQRQGRIGFYGAAFGQEAVPVAAALAIAPEDWVFPALRESSMLLVRGFSLVTYIAQLFGNERDLLKGRQMPSHQSARSVHQVSWSSAIATQLPQAVGMAWAARRRGDRAIALAFLGDGATSHPDFHAALNFAGVLRAPVLFVCQNNQYALSVPAARQTRAASFALKARAYGLPGVRVDGNDPLAVYREIRLRAERARREGEAVLIECVTYRRGPHSSSDDPSRYRLPEEERAWAERDPVSRMRTHLTRAGALDQALEQRLVQAIDDEIDAAIREAEDAPPPPVSSLFDDVYARRPFHLEEQARSLVPR
jgi:pyruvate dehydrogenase E1 component alpha subunit/2-oxoisovalerate dehydrogenase E1 component alpha subunit